MVYFFPFRCSLISFLTEFYNLLHNCLVYIWFCSYVLTHFYIINKILYLTVSLLLLLLLLLFSNAIDFVFRFCIYANEMKTFVRTKSVQQSFWTLLVILIIHESNFFCRQLYNSWIIIFFFFIILKVLIYFAGKNLQYSVEKKHGNRDGLYDSRL